MSLSKVPTTIFVSKLGQCGRPVVGQRMFGLASQGLFLLIGTLPLPEGSHCIRILDEAQLLDLATIPYKQLQLSATEFLGSVPSIAASPVLREMTGTGFFEPKQWMTGQIAHFNGRVSGLRVREVPRPAGTYAYNDFSLEQREHAVFYHGTTYGGAMKIFLEGVDLGRGDGELGKAFYLTSSLLQAAQWATQRADTDGDQPIILKVLLSVAALEKIQKSGTYLGFDILAFQNAQHPEGSQFFKNVVNANREIAYSLGGTDLTHPFRTVQFVSAPVSTSQSFVYDQVSFMDTDLNRSIFDPLGGDVFMTALDVK